MSAAAQVLNLYLESTKRQIEEEISAAAEVKPAGPYTVQQMIQEQPETQRQLSEVKARISELAQQNSQVILADDVKACCLLHAHFFHVGSIEEHMQPAFCSGYMAT
jgi:thiamine monophosphate synthase